MKLMMENVSSSITFINIHQTNGVTSQKAAMFVVCFEHVRNLKHLEDTICVSVATDAALNITCKFIDLETSLL